jgi:hypothetical protein
MNYRNRKIAGAVLMDDNAGATGGTGDGGATGGTGGTGDGGSTGAAAAWFDSFKDPGVKEWLKNYNNAYPDAESVAVKALNLEKFVGAEKAGRGIIVPKPDDKPEVWREFYAKVGGVPADPSGYKIPDTLTTDPMAKQFTEFAHKSGIPPVFVSGMLEWYQQHSKTMAESMVTEFEKKSEAELASLKDEWKGDEYDKNIELARRTAKAFIPHANKEELADMLTRMEGAVGTKTLMKMFASMGSAISEDNFVMGEGNGGFSANDVEGARARIGALKQDKEWMSRWQKGGTAERAEWDKLHKIAYPGTVQ